MLGSLLSLAVVSLPLQWGGSASTITCCDGFSCSNDAIGRNDTEYITCNGFGACFNSSLTCEQSVACAGSRSCSDSPKVNVTDGGVFADGYLSLAWSKEVILSGSGGGFGSPRCGGEASCIGINSLNTYVSYGTLCYGARSCENIVKAEVQDTQAYGAFALMNSILYSGWDSLITVRLYGYYSGFNASLYCQNGHSCYVQCGINGCVNFNFFCGSGSWCTCDCDDVTTACPNGWFNGSYTGKFYDFDEENFSLSYSDSSINLLYKKSYTRSYDDELESECSSADSAAIETECRSLARCGGCVQPEDPTGAVRGPVDRTVCVNGYAGLRYHGLNFTGSGKTLFCNGDFSCYWTQVSYNNESNSVYCRGTSSCSNSNYENFKQILVTGESAFKFSKASYGIVVTCSAYEACREASFVGIEALYATGYLSLEDATVVSSGTDLEVFLLGYQSGEGLEIICTGTDVCTIYTLNEGYGAHSVQCDESESCTIEYVVVNTTGDADAYGETYYEYTPEDSANGERVKFVLIVTFVVSVCMLG